MKIVTCTFLCLSIFIQAHDLSAEHNRLGVPYSVMHAPWRDSYVPLKAASELQGCPFCEEPRTALDEKYLILYRGKYAYIALNPFPYTKGHILLMPYEHVGRLQDLSSDARAEMMELTALTLRILEETYQVTASNVGFNIGRLAGSSIPDHVHLHIVPRSYFIPSFMQTIANTSVATFDMGKVYTELKARFTLFFLKEA